MSTEQDQPWEWICRCGIRTCDGCCHQCAASAPLNELSVDVKLIAAPDLTPLRALAGLHETGPLAHPAAVALAWRLAAYDRARDAVPPTNYPELRQIAADEFDKWEPPHFSEAIHDELVALLAAHDRRATE